MQKKLKYVVEMMRSRMQFVLPCSILLAVFLFLFIANNSWPVQKMVTIIAGFCISAVAVVMTVIIYLLRSEIRQRKRLTVELQQQKEYFNIALNSITEGLITTNRNGEIVYANRAAEKLSGWQLNEMTNQPVEKIFRVTCETAGEPFENIISRIKAGKKAIEPENNTVLHTKEAGQIVISNNGAPLYDAEGHLEGIILAFRDITESKKIKEELKQAETLLKELQRIAKTGNWKFDIATDKIIWSDDMYEGHGVSHNALGPARKTFMEEMRLSKAIIDAQETERQQIGMELHDNVNQILGTVIMYIGIIKQNIKNGDDITEMLELSRASINGAINEIRELSHRLAPTSFEYISLPEIVESLMHTVNADKKFDVKYAIDIPDNKQLPNDLKITIYRILQEQASNIIKYARATQVEIDIKIENDIVRLRIADNGCGFDVKTIKKGIGLENIKRRVKMWNGEFHIKSSPGSGCEIVADLPLKIN